ncbi:MAG: hypothetical protein LBI02_03160 [Opitutaceae bacterium]|nr:hypothetical protein [Opitutaceae bacterium]
MEKQLKNHLAFVTRALAELEASGNPHPDADARARLLLGHHLAQTAAFQHERLIHLLVTLFFGALLLAAMICTKIWPLWQFLALDALLLVIELFYIKHYFVLENTVQKFYPLTQRLHRFLDHRPAD